MTIRERWSIRRYQTPHLDVRSMRRCDGGIELATLRGSYRLSCGPAGGNEAALEPILAALRDPNCSLWRAVRAGDGEVEGLLPMLRDLDHLGLIREGASVGDPVRQDTVGAMLRAWSAELGGYVQHAGGDACSVLRHLVECLAADGDLTLTAILAEPNFAVLTMRLQAGYLRVDAPAMLALLIQGLSAAEQLARPRGNIAHGDGIQTLPSWVEEEWSTGLLDIAVVRRYLRSVAGLVREAIGPEAGRRLRSRRVSTQSLSGINFMIELEGEVALELAEHGPSAAFAASRDAELAPSVVRAAFLQEYLVTCRFIECIAPLLSRRFVAPLRDSVHRYFSEEVGHERFERQNCVALGLTAAEIDEAEPLPLHLAFIDIVTSLAHVSPIAFFCASIFTEGLIGDQSSLVTLAQQAMPADSALLHAIGHHVAVNDDADHRGVGRDWMSHVPVVPPLLQSEISELMAYLGELNGRMWEQLVQHCKDGIAAVRAPESVQDLEVSK